MTSVDGTRLPQMFMLPGNAVQLLRRILDEGLCKLRDTTTSLDVLPFEVEMSSGSLGVEINETEASRRAVAKMLPHPAVPCVPRCAQCKLLDDPTASPSRISM
jgi:hypothetical protein